MEGAGEGMVAIVQGLQDAGLAVTLMEGRCHDLNKRLTRAEIIGVRNFNQVPLSKSSVETSTRNNSAQICDDKYSSSYQLAYCRVRPSSPPIQLSEFPPQRTAPCRTQGNFEVGAHGSGEATYTPIRDTRSCRRSFDWPVRDVCSSRSSRGTDPFVHSLRKYPSLLPGRTVSTELVQRLLSYTQAKNFAKDYSKSMRSLLQEKSSNIKEEKLETKLSKNIQTYTRTKHRGTKEISPNINNEIRLSFGDNSKLIDKHTSNYASKNNLPDVNYDYLKASHTSSPRYIGRSTEARYLNDVTRCIRDTLRQIYDDKPVVCPTIRSRYSRHKREHHKICTRRSACQQTCPTQPPVCYYCHQPRPCACDPSTSTTVQISESIKLPQVICHCKENRDNENALESLIFDWLKEVPVCVNDSAENKAKREEMGKKLANMLKALENDEKFKKRAREEINKCLGILPMWCPGAKHDQELFRDQIADNLLNKLKHLSNDSVRKDSRLLKDKTQKYVTIETDLHDESPSNNHEVLKQYMREEVSDVLDKYNIKNKEIEENVVNLLADQVVRGGDDRKTVDQMFSILQNANVSEQHANEISNQLVGITKEMSLGYKSQDSTTGFFKYRLNKGSHSPMQRETFGENAERVIFDFIEEKTGEDAVRLRTRRKKSTEQLVERLEGIIFDPNQREDMIRSEVIRYLRNSSIDADVPGQDLASELTNRLKNLAFQTSTPRKGVKGRDFPFYPRRDGESFSISSIHSDDNDFTGQMKKSSAINKSKSNEEQKYANELIDEIERWINELPIDLNSSANKGFKDTMINDLVGDIIDRQKYLQLNPDAKSTDREELEYLKYQVFRWLNKLLDVNDMTPILPKTEFLMDRLKNVQVPQLVKPSGKRRDAKLDTGKIPVALDALEDEISMWLEEIPRDLCTSTDSSFHQQMIRELAEKIQKFKNSNRETEIDNEISKWLNKVVTATDKQNLDKLAEALKSRLKSKGFTGTSKVITQDSSQFIEENLTGGIMDWLKDLPLYQKGTPQEKSEIDKLIPELAKGLKTVFETVPTSAEVDTDEIFINEIVRHLKNLPIDKEQKSNEDFLRRTSIQLLHYLKGMQMFQNISDRHDRPPDEYLIANIEDWVNSLSVSLKMSPSEMRLFENLKAELIPKLKKIRTQDDQTIKNEIEKFLLMLPIDNVKKQDANFINEKVEQLFKNLQVVPVEGEDRKSFSDIETNDLKSWSKSRKNLSGIENNDLASWSKSSPVQSKDNQNKENKPVQDTLTFFNETSLKTKTVDVLFKDLEQWCEDLFVSVGKTSENETAVKQNLTKRLIKKIGELNMNPQIFNDDFLYEDLLRNEIDDLLNDVPKNAEVKSRLADLKETLMEKVKESRKKIQCDVAGQAYLKQLREVVSKTISQFVNLSTKEQANFEVLKDDLADAFINLHYVGDEELKKYKNKITDEVDKFCNNYLKLYPATPVDSRKLNQDLYNALRNVPLPNEESLRSDVEFVKLKDEINDWVKELPLRDQTESEQLQTKKIITVLAKNLHDLEKEKKNGVNIEADHMMRKEITSWLKKLPLKSTANNASQLVDKLISNLKNTEESRRISSSKRHIIDADFTFGSVLGSKCSCYNNSLMKQKTIPLGTYSYSNMSQYVCPFPPSTLSNEDRAHLQIIRERSPLTPRFRIPPPKSCIDACVSPPPIDVGSQTDVKPCEIPNSPAQQASSSQTQPCPYKESTYSRMQEVGSQVEISPQVIVKEYFWDSTVNSSLQESTSQPCPPPCPEYHKDQVSGHSYAASHTQRIPCPGQRSFIQQPSSFSCDQSQQTPAPSACVISQHPPTSYIIPQDNPCIRSRARRVWDNNPQSCPGRQEMPGPSHMEDPEIGTSGSFRATPGQRIRITHLGSLDDCQDPRCKRPKKNERMSDDDFCWSSVRFPENNSEFWGGRRLVVTSDEDIDEPYTKEREKREEKVRCRCSERVLTKFRRPRGLNNSVKHCSKCCGIHCPYPSYLYFRE